MAFPTTSVLTNFTGVDEDPLRESATWGGIIQSGTNEATRVGNAVGRAVGGSWGGYRVGISSANLEAFLTLATLAGTDQIHASCRIQNPGNASTAAQYLGIYQHGTGFLAYKMTGGSSFLQIGSTNATAAANSDKLGLEVNGTSLTVYHFTGGSWVARVSATDSAISGAGTVGVVGSGGSIRGDDFGGGAIVAATTALPPVQHPGIAHLIGR